MHPQQQLMPSEHQHEALELYILILDPKTASDICFATVTEISLFRFVLFQERPIKRNQKSQALVIDIMKFTNMENSLSYIN